MRNRVHRVQYFLLKLRTRFLLTNVYNNVFGIFYILFRSCVIKIPGFDTLVLYILLVTQDLNKMKKNPKRAFVDIAK